MRPGALTLVLLVLLSAPGCGGGTLSPKAFQIQAEAIQSLASESALVAKEAAADRTTDTFVRVHSEYLRKAAQKVETELRSSHAKGDLDRKRQEAVTLAATVSEELGRLHGSPGDRMLAARLRGKFADDARAAGELAK
jgi:hypothetical protein